MTELYRAKRREFSGSRQSPTQNISWGIVCVLLLACIGGLWTYAQSLSAKNTALERQLRVAQQPADATTCIVNGSWEPNKTTIHSVNNRQYLLHTPANFTPEQYYPIVMFYPGKGATAEAAQAAYGLDSLPAILIYPHPTMSIDGYPAWEGAPYSSGSDDVKFTEAIIEKTDSDLCVDRTRIYAVGMSNGGGFVSVLSCDLPGRFAAYAIIAGAMYAPAGDCKPPRPAPLINIHGDHDPIVPYDGSVVRRLPAVEAWSASRAGLNGCKSQATVPEGISLSVTTWSKCKDDANVQSVRVIGGGHAWGDVTNDAIWQFLSRFSL